MNLYAMFTFLDDRVVLGWLHATLLCCTTTLIIHHTNSYITDLSQGSQVTESSSCKRGNTSGKVSQMLSSWFGCHKFEETGILWGISLLKDRSLRPEAVTSDPVCSWTPGANLLSSFSFRVFFQVFFFFFTNMSNWWITDRQSDKKPRSPEV